MGCGSTKEKLQTEMLVLQLEKAEIQEERERLIHQLQLLTNKEASSIGILRNNIIDRRKIFLRTQSGTESAKEE